MLQSTLLEVEADCYWCLCKLIECIQDHYTYAQPGIQRTVFKIKELVRQANEHGRGGGLLLTGYCTRQAQGVIADDRLQHASAKEHDASRWYAAARIQQRTVCKQMVC